MPEIELSYAIIVSSIWIAVIGTSVWVLIDARTIGVRKGMIDGFFDMGPGSWFASCLLLWIVAFPAYLAKRSEYQAVAAGSEPEEGDASEIAARIEQLHGLAARGVLTDQEFQATKAELLGRL